MIALLTTILLAQPSPSPPHSGDLRPASETKLTPPKPGKRHSLRAHRKLRQRIRVQLIPNLRSYKAISNDVVSRLGFLDEVKDIAAKLDRFRKNSVTKALENTLPGFRWVTTGWDYLNELIERMKQVRSTMKKLRQTSNDLLKAAERYTKSPNDERFQSLLDGYEDAKKTFKDAQATLTGMKRFMKKANSSLRKTAGVLDRISKTPWVGRYVDKLGKRVRSLDAQLKLLQAVLDICNQAIERDKGSLAGLVTTFQEAHAHDAYDAATTLADADRPGSALAAFRDLATRWPDTEWAHRSDRRIVELITYIDQLERDMKTARAQVAALKAELAKKPKVVVRTVVKTELVPLETQKSFPWGLTATILVGLGAAFWYRRRKTRPS